MRAGATSPSRGQRCCGPQPPAGRRIQKGTSPEEADYADRLRRSAGWAPKHRAEA